MEEMGLGKSVLYLAISVDGYLADEQGGMGWLAGDGSEPDAPGSYPAFWDTVDAIVMGWTTYHQLITELSQNSRSYEGRPCYVVTHRQKKDQENILFWNGELPVLVDKLKGAHEGNVWLCGGASMAGQLLKEGASISCGCRSSPPCRAKAYAVSGTASELPLK
jgi:dihydrofolate reductase